MKKLILIVFLGTFAIQGANITGNEILKRADENMTSETKIVIASMIVHGRRAVRKFKFKSWIMGTEKSFTEFLAPPRERGTKMLKIKKQLWLYSPSADRVILIAGHMLRQSMMGSDLSYEDTLEDPKLHNLYNAEIIGEETYLDRPCWVLKLTAKVKDVAYFSRKVWVDKEHFLILKEEMYARSGRLLKIAYVKEVKRLSGRWVATRAIFKDVLKKGKGTEFIIEDIKFDVKIPPHIFSKAALRK
ncbi:MAG: outer membrane lipoprotein-sorting protein [Candidatus Aminicenantes bacterium]|nr:outer membrane lipoprotein-sorting protein [Candidatus Aminicenantes bacterium]